MSSSDESVPTITFGTANRTVTIGGPSVSAPVPVGCACGSFDTDPLGCVPEYEIPGLGAVVPKGAYVRMRQMHLRRSPVLRFHAWREMRRVFRLRWWQRIPRVAPSGGPVGADDGT